jgi:GH24 family phage-related lysozyme (muramidase)
MKTSLDGMIAILASEAVVLSSYDDGAGVWTIGVGHTAAAGQPHPKPGVSLTLRQALKLFVLDLHKFETGVMKAFTTPLNQHEFDGFASFHFNTGQAGRGSVDDKWDAGNRAGAMKTLLSYNKAKGKVRPGLTKRRAEEKAMIMEGRYPAVRTITVAAAAHRGKLSGARKVAVDEIKALLREIMNPVPAMPANTTAKNAPPERDASTVAPASQRRTGAGVEAGAAAGAAVVATGGAASAFGLDWHWVLIGGAIVIVLALIILLSLKKEKSP